jgi:YidC/Oxa1 family membrane protein insertase
LSILDPINDLVAWVIMHIYNVLSPALGPTAGITWVLSIAILVVGMRLILLPLFIKQMHTQRAMTALTPKINEIRKKYKGDKEKLNSETMKLYQEAGVNPLMGCLPIVLQMPLFFALFSVLREIAERKPGTALKYNLKSSFVTNVNKADIFGVQIKNTFLHGTSLHVHIVVAFVVLISMGTTYLTVRQSMKRGMMPTGSDNPMGQSQKLMAYVMPLFALTGLYWPFGLVLYWVLTNLWTLGQQYVLLRKYPVGAAAAMTGGNVPIGKSPAPAPGLTSGSAKPKRPASSAPSSSSASSAKSTANGQGGTGSKKVQDAKPAANGSANGQGGTGGKKVQDAKPTGSAASANGTASANGDKSAPGPVSDGAAKNGASPTTAGTAGTAATNGHNPANSDGGMLRRFSRKSPEPEPVVPVQPDTKIVRNQPQRQSRSKRSGKR